MSLQALAALKPQESALYVNDARYARLWALWKEVNAQRATSQADADQSIGRLLCQEARLLDERRYDEWLDMFASECIYWVPSHGDPADPRFESGIYLDDRRRMTDRVAMIRTGHLHAQTPPSRTRRLISNIEHWTRQDGSVLARANMVIWEHRKGQTRAHPGMQVYEILREPSGAVVIATKIVCLLDCDAPQGNYSFML